jgi:hypothetical protein
MLSCGVYRRRTLLLYITATVQVISIALVVGREEPVHVYKIQ